ncbi:amino acid permease [Candidatus Woesearchaeota archaeon]|nr:amino acid permease [Candidatus Woesearchaeota archaeon]
MAKHFLAAIATLTGFIIGAGVLGIPYVMAKAGFLTGLIDLILIGIAILFLNLYTGEIALRTKGSHQLTGYANKYYGKEGKYLMAIFITIGLYGALSAYIVKGGQFLSALLTPTLGGTPLAYSIIFFTVFSILVFIGLRVIEKSELLMCVFFILIIFAILIFALPNINQQNLASFELKNIFIPYGVILFAFFGVAAIPEIREELKNNEKVMKKAIIIGSTIPIIIYIVFALVVVGASSTVTDGAILGLSEVLGYKMLLLGVVFGILTIATSFIGVALALKETYMFDFRLKPFTSSIIACFIPLIMALIIITSDIKNAFFKVLDITGTFGGSLAAIFIVLIYFKAKKYGNRKPEYTIKHNFLGFILILMFILGLLYKVLELTGLIKI